VSTPRVSVIVPVRDEEEFLGEALDSLAAQTLERHEVVVVDDGSTDGTAALAETYARRDRRVRVFRQPPRGMIAASERARAEARAPLLARLDGDDVALPDRLELQAAAIEEEGLAAVGGQVEYFPDPSDGMQEYAGWLNSLVTVDAALRDVWVECPLPGPGMTMRAELVSYREQGWPEDYDIVLRLLEAGHRFRNLDRLVLRWRDHPERLTRTQPEYSLDAFRRCKVHFLRRTLLAGGRPAVVWGAGPTGKAFARALLEAGTPVAAFVEVDPRKLGKRIHGAPVVPVDEAASFPGALSCGAVAGADGRARVRELAAALRLVEGEDFVAVA
jgi:glycosyltransferase involved in cell wall biosynthesis